ncbi:MAG TPA: hypothetical protein VFA12_03010 [Stellaceae bacterium]|nr:hypothetical protein [Stellaceae bacterium]
MSRDVQQKLAGALRLTEAPGEAAQSAAADPEPGPAPRVTVFEPTPFRLFCVPFEDMLGEEPLPPDSTRIVPAVANLCWQVIVERLNPVWLAAIAEELKESGGAHVDALGAALWPECEQALAAEIADTRAGRRRTLAERTPKNLFRRAETITAALHDAGWIQRLKRLLGTPPVGRLDRGQRQALREAVEQLARRRDARIAVHVAAHRLRNPAELFAVLAGAELGPLSALGQALDEERDSLILSHVAAALAALDEPISGREALTAATEHAETAAAILATASGLEHHVGEAALLRDVERMQQALAERLDASLVPALRDGIVSAWDPATIDAAPDERILAAEDAARAAARLGRDAMLIGTEYSIGLLVTDALSQVHEATRHLAASAQQARDESARRCAFLLVAAIRLVEILAGSERAFAVLTHHRPVLQALWAPS